MNCGVLPQAVLAAGRAGSSLAPNCRKGNQGLDIKGCGWVTLLGTGTTIDPGPSAPNLGHVLQSDDNIRKAMTFFPAHPPM